MIDFVKVIVLLMFVASAPATAKSDADVVKPTSDFSKIEPYEQFPGGATTHNKRLNSDAFSFPSNNMGFERQLRFAVGNRLFTREWVSASPSTINNGGIGPLFNAQSCQACHFKDGRGHLPQGAGDNLISLILKLDNNEKPDPVYGVQFQDFSIQGVKPEGKITVDYTHKEVLLSGGEIVSLRKPEFSVGDLNYGDLGAQTKLQPRIAPQMIGLGLLESIAEADILANVDEADLNNDGIKGLARRVTFGGAQYIGRFGWKGEAANLEHQTQLALLHDMGLSSAGFGSISGDCTSEQTKCFEHSKKYKSGGHEISQTLLDEMVFYVRNLAVPKRREPNSGDVLAGKKLFYQAGCTGCHKPKFITPVSETNLEQSRQLIWPYSDLLLHDMGEGLADPSDNAGQDARLWRTPPLWGIGLTALVNNEYGFLHDGRARNILEAILWHGGEAESSKQTVVEMTSDQRRKLLLFVNSL